MTVQPEVTTTQVNSGDKTVNQTTVQPDKVSKWAALIQTLGFPIVVASVLLYMQFTTMNKVVTTLELINGNLISIDRKLDVLVYAKGASGK